MAAERDIDPFFFFSSEMSSGVNLAPIFLRTLLAGPSLRTAVLRDIRS